MVGTILGTVPERTRFEMPDLSRAGILGGSGGRVLARESPPTVRPLDPESNFRLLREDAPRRSTPKIVSIYAVFR